MSRDGSYGSALAEGGAQPAAAPEVEVALLTGGFDAHYACGLATTLASKGVRVDLIGGAGVDCPEMHGSAKLRFLDLYWDSRTDAGRLGRLLQVLAFYARLLRYAWSADAKIFHILWNNKFQYIDRTLLMLYYRLLGKRVVLTAHNVNAAKRDASDSFLNRLTLTIQYRLADGIFVHTERMKQELVDDFGVEKDSVTTVTHPINIAIPRTNLTPAEARDRLGIDRLEKVVLFFGSVRPYKGLEDLVAAFQRVAATRSDCRLLIAGDPKKGAEAYLEGVRRQVSTGVAPERVTQHYQYVADSEIEVYFKAADVLALPYRDIYQSGVLFVGYTFGLPAIAADVGSFREDIVEGSTGFLCRPNDTASMAETLERFFESDLCRELSSRRQGIADFASARYSWNNLGDATCRTYGTLVSGR